MKDKIVELLGAGVAPSAVAAATGVEASYVSQVAAEYGEEISAKRATKATEHVAHDATLDALEDRALQKLGRLMDTVIDPMKIVGVFKTLNGAKRRSEAAIQTPQPAEIVSIELPAMARTVIKVSTANQVIEVDSRPMITMQAKGVEELLKEKKERQQAETLELLNAPAVIETSKFLDAL